ncbi:MAG: HD domain-containing phosphohydrolase [Bacillota bacterium]
MLNALFRETEKLGQVVADWAFWDDTYEFVNAPNAKYVAANLGEQTLENLELNAMLFFSPSGSLVYSKILGPDLHLPEFILPLLKPQPSPLNPTQGILMAGDVPLIVAWRPILRSDRSGPPAGWLAFCRIIDQAYLRKLSDMTLLPLTLHLPAWESVEGVAAGTLHNGQTCLLTRISQDESRGHVPITDVKGNLAFILEFSVPRRIAQTYEAANRYYCLIMVATLVLLCAIAWVALDKMIVTRLHMLAQDMLKLRASREFSGHVVSFPGNDEIAVLSHEVNDLLKAIEDHKTQLRNSDQLFRTVVDFLPDPTFAIDFSGKVTIWNRAIEELTGVQAAKILGSAGQAHSVALHGEPKPLLADIILDPDAVHKATYTTVIRNRDGTLVGEDYSAKLGIFAWAKAAPILDSQGRVVGAIETIRDITSMRQAQQELRYQKQRFEALFSHSQDAVVFFDNDGCVRDVNSRFCELFGYELQEIKGKSIAVLFESAQPPQSMASVSHYEPVETVAVTKHGNQLQVAVKTVPVLIDNSPDGSYLILQDITQRKLQEARLEYLSLHDVLTGLYNRAFFEKALGEMDRWKFPVTVLVADLDGLKLINDTMGHNKGDEVLRACAKLIAGCLTGSSVLARIGGDEFAAIMPETDERNASLIVERIHSQAEVYNQMNPSLPLSISMGFATTVNPKEPLSDTFRKADDTMYRDKLLRGASARSRIVSILSSTLAERDFVTQGHTKRVEELCVRMGKKLGLSQRQVADLALFAQVHDLGKVGIPDSILFKPGPLTAEEQAVMRTHPEKGYRIALSSPDLASVAELILKHHERWDGTGYPLGLKGEEIPLECRVLAIVDAYDAMVNDRPYSKAKTKEQAISELKRQAGSQFDPRLVETFLMVLEEEAL